MWTWAWIDVGRVSHGLAFLISRRQLYGSVCTSSGLLLALNQNLFFISQSGLLSLGISWKVLYYSFLGIWNAFLLPFPSLFLPTSLPPLLVSYPLSFSCHLSFSLLPASFLQSFSFPNSSFSLLSRFLALFHLSLLISLSFPLLFSHDAFSWFTAALLNLFYHFQCVPAEFQAKGKLKISKTVTSKVQGFCGCLGLKCMEYFQGMEENWHAQSQKGCRPPPGQRGP